MQLTSEQIKGNWDKVLSIIDQYIQEPRKTKLLEFYKTYELRLSTMPASSKVGYHNAFVGGYVDHVLRVIKAALYMSTVWEDMECVKNFTDEELVFASLNHDLGKMGTKEHEYYIPNPSQWHIDNKGEPYTYNTKVTYMSIPDRSLHLLTQHGIEYSENELMAIKLHDGMYEEANKPYLTSYIPEAKPRTSLIYIIHQADQLAARVEFEREWFPKFEAFEPGAKKKSNKQDKVTKTFKTMNVSNTLSKSVKDIMANI